MRVSEACVLNLKNKSHTVTANITVPEAGADGVIITQGGTVGGWTLYAHEGKLKYCYNFLGIEHYMVPPRSRSPPESTRCAWSSRMTAAVWRRAVTSRCTTTARLVGHGRVEQTEPMMYSSDEACDVGADTGSPASPDYGPTGNKFTGQIDWVQIDLGDDSHDHLIKPEDRLTIAMAKQ